ncbi:unnamed protein product [Pleuronectes platessa]|uniref:Uncharacterized protein n=1 Tax=Pleuronectes platessa TaxID=8262 RepID=A0A9N7YL09_PLEPL|nr:unnamed protein product [Pleuronectes platessa]
MGREHFQFDQFSGAGYELRRLQDGAVLCGRPVYGQQVIPSMQRSTPAEEEETPCLTRCSSHGGRTLDMMEAECGDHVGDEQGHDLDLHSPTAQSTEVIPGLVYILEPD